MSDPQEILASTKSLSYLLDRLEEVALQEIDLLSKGEHVNLDDINKRKSQYFLELTRVMRLLKGQPVGPDIFARLAHLNKILEKNRVALENHIAAVQEIAVMMTRIIDEAHSDGTYNRSPSTRTEPSGNNSFFSAKFFLFCLTLLPCLHATFLLSF